MNETTTPNNTGPNSSASANKQTANSLIVQWWPVGLLSCMLFFTFAMTTDAIGNVLPQIIKEFDLSLSQASAFHYSTMIGIALGGIALGHLADRFGHRNALVVGLALYGISCLLFMVGEQFAFFLCLLFCGGLAIGVFKTAALAIVGDITTDSHQHTRAMNLLEGFFAVGAIVGPALVGILIASSIAWQYLYLTAAVLCLLLLAAALIVKYPPPREDKQAQASFVQTLAMMRDPYALCFSLAIAAYVAVEVAIYVWMPTLLEKYTGSLYDAAKYALMLFFILRATGRFLGWLILERFSWTAVLMWFTLAILICYLLTLALGIDTGVVLLPLSGLFMSVIYPTLNSKAISCFPKERHSSIAGLTLFFTAASAALIPLLMGLVGDQFGDIYYGFAFISAIAALLFAGMVYNHIYQPTTKRLGPSQANDG